MLSRTVHRIVPLVLLAVLLGGCSSTVTGNPTGVAGFDEDTRTATTVLGTRTGERSTGSAPNEASRPKHLDGVDTCSLLLPEDLTGLGGASGEPSRDTLLPESCVYPLNGAPEDQAAVAFFKPYDQVREQQPQGTEVRTRGYPTWVVCEADEGYQTCSAAVDVHEERTLVAVVSKRDTPRDALLDELNALTVTVLDRLPED
ncbi:MAG TPA: DUF3558 family protein [Pseudonocardiaceae bacterium]